MAAGYVIVDPEANYDFALARYDPYGTLDPMFGTEGKVTTDFFGYYDGASAVVIQEDGEIVAAGSAGGSSETDFALARYLGAGPAIASVSPAAVGQGGTVTATITGSGFLPGEVASVSGSGVSVTSTTYVSPTKVKAHLTVAPDAAPGPRDVTVTDPSGGTGTCPGCLMVDPGPTPTSAAPASGARGAMEYVMISGSGFQPGAQVRFGPGITVSTTRFLSSGELKVSITIAGNAATGPRPVGVVNPTGARGPVLGASP